MSVSTGIGPLDDRADGLERGGLYLLSSPPTPARAAAVTQFLSAGLEADERVGLVTRARPERLFRSAERIGRPLEEAWRDGRLRLVGFRGEYEARLRRAGSPDEVFDELTSLLEPLPERLAFDPGTVLWEGRGDGSAAAAFVDFLEGAGATALATTTRELTGGLPMSTELVAQAALGIFRLTEAGGGLLRLEIHKLDEGRPDRAEVTVELREGEGLTAPTGEPARRSSDRPEAAGDELLHLDLGGALSEEISGWLRAEYRVTEAEDPLDLVSRLQDGGAWGLVVVSLGREGLADGRKACRVCWRMRPHVPVVVVSDQRLRASDRADLLQNGADECMTGGVNVEELASRLELAAARAAGRGHPPGPAAAADGGRSAPREDGDGEGPDGETPGRLDEEAFRLELRERLDAPGSRIFTVVRFPTGGGDEVVDRLRGMVRTTEGDFVGRLNGASAVWLADTAPSEADGFLRRVRDTVREATGEDSVEAEVLGSARDTDRLRELAG